MSRSALARFATALAATALVLTACGGEPEQPPAAGSLRIALEGEDTEFTPEIVRCNGEPGTIRNVVITTREDLTLLKITAGEFAMLRLHEQGPPEESDSTDGITAEEINNRPRRRLGFLTPTEAFARLLAGEPHVASTP